MPIKVKIVQLGKGVFPYDLDDNSSVEACLNAVGIPGSGMDLHVNGRPVKPGQKLQDGDLITIIPRIKGGTSDTAIGAVPRGDKKMWYLILSRAAGNEENRQRNHEEHLNWLLERHRAGCVLFSGPTADRRTGIYILLASSRSEAERIAALDPHHLYGDRTMEILEWEPRRALTLDGYTIADIEALARDPKRPGT